MLKWVGLLFVARTDSFFPSDSQRKCGCGHFCPVTIVLVKLDTDFGWECLEAANTVKFPYGCDGQFSTYFDHWFIIPLLVKSKIKYYFDRFGIHADFPPRDSLIWSGSCIWTIKLLCCVHVNSKVGTISLKARSDKILDFKTLISNLR